MAFQYDIQYVLYKLFKGNCCKTQVDYSTCLMCNSEYMLWEPYYSDS